MVSPKDADTLADVGTYLFQTGRIDEAAARLERAVSLQPGLARALRYLGEVRFKQKRYSEGLELQKRAIEADPSNVQLVVDHAAALESYGDPHDAEAVLQAALDRGLGDERISIQLGKHERDGLRFDEAIAILKRAVEIAPGNGEAHFELAKTYSTQARYDEALKEFQEANRLAPSDPYAYYYIGVILARQGRTEESIALFRRSLALDPANPKAHYALARALQKTGRKQEADREFAVHGDLLKRLRERKHEGVATAD